MEQTMMDLDSMEQSIDLRQLPFPLTLDRIRSQNSEDEDEFFEDFITEDDDMEDTTSEKSDDDGMEDTTTKKNGNDGMEDTTTKKNENEGLEAMNVEEKLQHEIDRNAYSSYSYTTSSSLDKNGKRVVNTRRRYEDSNGRLKAIHDREIDGKKLKAIWLRKNKNDEGEHKLICSSGTVDEFEKMWADTPFGKAKAKHDQSLQYEQPSALESVMTDTTENNNAETMNIEQ